MNLELSIDEDPEVRQAWHPQRRAAVWSWGALAGSAVMFFGYAYPALFIMFAPAVSGSWISVVAAPQFLPTEYGDPAFIGSGALLVIAAWFLWCARYPRALDPELLRRCRKLRMYNRWALKCAAGFWLSAVIVVYIVASLHLALGGA